MEEDYQDLRFLSTDILQEITKQHKTPFFVYSQKIIEDQCDKMLQFPNAFGLTVRFAMKSNPNLNILRIMRRKGIQIDASSIYEVIRALHAGFTPNEIALTSQELSPQFERYVKMGVKFNACSLRQLEIFGRSFPGKQVSIRINPGLGSGWTNKTDVGGKHSSFGIWFEHLDQVLKIAREFDLHIVMIHSHIGSGSDPIIWKATAERMLSIVLQFPECHTISLGGGFKVARMKGEVSIDLHLIGQQVCDLFHEFYQRHGRKLHLEIEPGTFLVANAGSLVSRVNDIVDTGTGGFHFVKLDTGMDMNTRPSLYGARHPMIVIPTSTKNREKGDYVIVGHCCETGDLMTQDGQGNPERRTIWRPSVGDLLVIEGCGGYCSSMSTKNYNSFPEAAEVLLDKDNRIHLIRKRQTMKQIVQNEVPIVELEGKENQSLKAKL